NPFSHDFKDWIDRNIYFIMETTGNKDIIHLLEEIKPAHSILVPHTVLELLLPLLNDWSVQISNLELILNNIRDGLIVIDMDKNIKFINDTASKIIDIPKESAARQPIKQVIPNTRLPNVLRNRLKEVNQKLSLRNGKQIVSARIPLIN